MTAPLWYNGAVAPPQSDPRRLSPIATALRCGALVLVGPALTVAFGLLPAALALASAVWIARRRALRIAAVAGVDDLPPALRRAAAAAVLAIAGVLGIVAARAIAALVVAFPAALWVLVLGLGIALVAAFVGGGARSRLAALVVAAGLVPAAASFGERFEAGAPDARGAAISGPILGIHPFQTTAVAIDGYGPFDVPINDYVEPDGSRGYDPTTYADALERTLHRIAEIHFADGPARAYEAFAGARVEAFTSPPLHERLDTAIADDPVPRIKVFSGSTGQRSRVEFVCPGKRVDPRGLVEDAVMERMCPDRYAAEGSAGLGLTGRWTGYSEFRGNERLSLRRVFGGAWTRAGDAKGWRAARREVQLIAFVLVVLAGLALTGGGRRRRAAEGLAAWGVAVVALVGTIAGGLLLAAGPLPTIGLLARPAEGADLWAIAGWLPALAIGAGLGDLVALREGAPALRGRGWLAIVVAAVTLAAASWLALTAWITPDLWQHLGQGSGAGTHLMAMEGWVIEVADRLAQRAGWSVGQAEAAVAGGLVAALVGLLAAAAQGLPNVARELAPRLGRLAYLLPLVIAGSLVVSKQTHGGALLLGPALGIAATTAAAIAVVRSAGQGRRIWAAVLGLAALTSLWGLADALRQTTRQGPFVIFCVAAGGLLTAALVAGAFARREQAR